MNLTMKTFIEWCKHYEYNPESPEAQADYSRYREQLELFQSLPEEPPTFIPSAVFVQLYHLESEKGYWLAGGFGYTKSLTDAGRFSLDDMKNHNIDGCTLHRVRD